MGKRTAGGGDSPPLLPRGSLMGMANTDILPIGSEEPRGLGELFKLLSEEMKKIVKVLIDGPSVDEFKKFVPRNNKDGDNGDDNDGVKSR